MLSKYTQNTTSSYLGYSLNDFIDYNGINHNLINTQQKLHALMYMDKLHKEAYNLTDYPWKLHLTIHYGPSRFKYDTVNSECLRENLIIKLMSYIRIKLHLHGKNIFWFACTEFGAESNAHLHVLLGAHKRNFKTVESKLIILSSIAEVAKHFDVSGIGSPKIVDIHNPYGSLAYLCKKQFGRKDKSFYFSRSIKLK